MLGRLATHANSGQFLGEKAEARPTTPIPVQLSTTPRSLRRRNVHGQLQWDRYQTQTCSYRDRAASFSTNSSEEAPQSSWKARFMTDDDYEQQAEKDSNGTAPEEPFLVRKAKERFWGRMAVISLGAVMLSERLSGKGLVTALNMATGVPVWEIEPALGLLVGALLAAGIYPIIKRMAMQADMAADPESAGAMPTEPAPTVGESFQMATGRLACIALAGTILAEATTGKGILALLNVETGVEITEIEAGLTFILLLLFT